MQHGNIIADGKRLLLVDYDGMFVPSFEGRGLLANEIGLPHYQHPLRDETHFNNQLDHFASLSIYLSLKVLEHDSSLYTKGNDAIFFRKEDYVDPANSWRIKKLAELGYEEAAQRFQTICDGGLDAIPSLIDFIKGDDQLLHDLPASLRRNLDSAAIKKREKVKRTKPALQNKPSSKPAAVQAPTAPTPPATAQPSPSPAIVAKPDLPQKPAPTPQIPAPGSAGTTAFPALASTPVPSQPAASIPPVLAPPPVSPPTPAPVPAQSQIMPANWSTRTLRRFIYTTIGALMGWGASSFLVGSNRESPLALILLALLTGALITYMVDLFHAGTNFIDRMIVPTLVGGLGWSLLLQNVYWDLPTRWRFYLGEPAEFGFDLLFAACFLIPAWRFERPRTRFIVTLILVFVSSIAATIFGISQLVEVSLSSRLTSLFLPVVIAFFMWLPEAQLGNPPVATSTTVKITGSTLFHAILVILGVALGWGLIHTALLDAPRQGAVQTEQWLWVVVASSMTLLLSLYLIQSQKSAPLLWRMIPILLLQVFAWLLIFTNAYQRSFSSSLWDWQFGIELERHREIILYSHVLSVGFSVPAVLTQSPIRRTVLTLIVSAITLYVAWESNLNFPLFTRLHAVENAIALIALLAIGLGGFLWLSELNWRRTSLYSAPQLGILILGLFAFNKLSDEIESSPFSTEASSPRSTSVPTVVATVPSVRTATVTPSSTSNRTPTPTFVPTTVIIPTQPVVSGGNLIAFSSNRTGSTEQIYTLNLLTNQVLQLTSDNYLSTAPVWSPDGRQIMYIADANGADHGEIFIMNADGSNKRRLTNTTARNWQTSFSPDGQRILFISTRNGTYNDDTDFEIYTMNIDGSNQQRLTNNQYGDYRPRFSRDGQKIVFSSERDGDTDLYIMDADGGNEEVFITSGVDEDWFVWSPDGNSLAFTSQKNGKQAIFIVDKAGVDLRVVREFNFELITWMRWSPDGSQLMFQAWNDAENIETIDIYVVDQDGTDFRQITYNNDYDGDFVWSPTGNQIAYISRRDGNDSLYLINADGTGGRLLSAAGESYESRPAWQPIPGSANNLPQPTATPRTCTITAGENNVFKRNRPNTTSSRAVDTLLSGASATADGQYRGTDGIIWWHLTDNTWVREDIVIDPSSCDVLPMVNP